MGSGEEQEARAKQFVRRLGYPDVTAGEDEVKRLLKMQPVIKGAKSKCADIVGFNPHFANAISAIVCESKGTNVGHSLLQLGNVAAAILDHFDPASWLWSRLTLLVFVNRSQVVRLPIGDPPVLRDLPGPGYLVGEAVHAGLHVLLDAGTDDRRAAPATASIDLKRLDQRLITWGARVAQFPVYVYIEP
jgi:hypothetical protein